MSHPVVFAAACLTAVPLAYLAAVMVTTLWYERVYLPRIAGPE